MNHTSSKTFVHCVLSDALKRARFKGVMYTKQLSPFLLMIVMLISSALLNAADSIPSPTKLEIEMARSDSSVTSEVKLGEVSTPEVKLKISEVSVKTKSGNVLSGIKIELFSSNGSCIFSGCKETGSTDTLLLNSELVPVFLEELKEIESRNVGGYFGVARCRPSQPVPQAYCLESFKIDESDFGILVRTPQSWFKLNQVPPSDLGKIINRYGKSGDGGT